MCAYIYIYIYMYIHKLIYIYILYTYTSHTQGAHTRTNIAHTAPAICWDGALAGRSAGAATLRPASARLRGADDAKANVIHAYEY